MPPDATVKRFALPLPRYVLRKPLAGGRWAYFFNVPMWARAAGCAIKNEPLGIDYEKAVQRAEKLLLPAFDAWLRRRCRRGQCCAGLCESRDARLAVWRVRG
jgi:hypothetical protein